MGGIPAFLTSNDLFLDDANVLVPVWLGGRGDRPGFPIGRNRIFISLYLGDRQLASRGEGGGFRRVQPSRAGRLTPLALGATPSPAVHQKSLKTRT